MSALAGDHISVLVGGYDLTGDSNSISITDSRDQYDVTTFGDAVHKFINGQRMFSLEHSGFLNAETARSHPVLEAVIVDGVISVMVGQNATPVAGDPVFSLQTVQTSYTSLAEVNNAVPFTASFANRAQSGGWGTALAVDASFTDSANGSAIDGGAASTNGGVAFLHILTAAASDTYTIIVEGSATGAFAGEESTLATFTADASAVGSEWLALSGSIPRYTRWKATRTGSAGDSVMLSLNLVRL